MRQRTRINPQVRAGLRSQANREGWKLDVLDMDVTNEAFVNQAVQQALECAGGIDLVINNAGIAGQGITEAYTAEQFQQVFQVNLLRVVPVNRAVLPAMRHQRSGLLIHVRSGVGRTVVPGFAAYSASKFAQEALADAYRFELAPLGTLSSSSRKDCALEFSTCDEDLIPRTASAGRNLPECNGRVAVLGYCLGALMVFLTAVRYHRVDAAVAYHAGDTEKYLGEIDGLNGPLLMHLAEEDEFISKAAQAEIKAALVKKPNTTVYSYPGQHHAFARHNGAHYNAAAAALANGRTSEFLNRELR